MNFYQLNLILEENFPNAIPVRQQFSFPLTKEYKNRIGKIINNEINKLVQSSKQYPQKQYINNEIIENAKLFLQKVQKIMDNNNVNDFAQNVIQIFNSMHNKNAIDAILPIIKTVPMDLVQAAKEISALLSKQMSTSTRQKASNMLNQGFSPQEIQHQLKI